MIFGSARRGVNAGEGNCLCKNLKIVKCIQKEETLFGSRKSRSGVRGSEFHYVKFLG